MWKRLLLVSSLACGSVAAHDDGTPPPAGGTAFWAGPAMSGAWFDPARSGEGWMIEMQPDGTAVGVWFTYAPEGEAAGQRWVLASGGRVHADHIAFDSALVMSGARFGPGFDPADVEIAPWGTLDFTFADCNHGELQFEGPAAYGSGTRSFQRSIALADTGCTLTRPLTARGARAQAGLQSVAGTWFDPTHNGEGVILQPITADAISTTWFSYTPDGEAAWFTGIGTLQDDVLVVEAMTRPQGTRFGDGFDPDDVVAQPWGRVEIDFSACNAGELRYTALDAAYGSGTLQLQRATQPAGHVCLDAFPAARTAGTWSTGPAMPQPASEVSSAQSGSVMYIAGNYPTGRFFQQFDAATGVWTVLPELPGGRDHALSFVHDGGVYVVGGYRGGPDAATVAWRYDIAARTYAAVPDLPSVAASGATWLNGQIYLGNESGHVYQVDPRSGDSRRIAPPAGGVYRDHSQLVAWLGELWMIGGRITMPGQNRTHDAVAIYDPASDSWRVGPPLVDARAGFAAAVVDGQLLVAGGERLTDTEAMRSMEMIAPGAEGWVRGPQMPMGVHGVGGGTHAGKFYALGGSVLVGGADNPGTVQVYTPNP